MSNKGTSWNRCMWVRSDGQSVADFCRKNDVAYNLVHWWIEKLGNVDEACKKALERKGHKDNNTRYWIEGKSLARYCKEKGLKYITIYRRIRKRQEMWNEIRKCCQNCKYYECWDEEDGDYGCELSFDGKIPREELANYWDSYDKITVNTIKQIWIN